MNILGIKPEHIGLLESIANGRQYLDMGRTPVEAISLAFEWKSKDIIDIEDDNHLILTTKGSNLLALLKKHS